jgi:hypothetical protein
VDLDFVNIECEIVTDIPVQLTVALYNALKNFEVQFKALCCHLYMKSCTSCIDNIECPYRIVFSQQLSSDPEVVRSHQKPSLPLSLYIKEIDDVILHNTVGLVIIGYAVNYLDIFCASLIRMIETAVGSDLFPPKFRLIMYSLDYQGVRHEISQGAMLATEKIMLLSAACILQNTIHTDCVRLYFISPLRMQINGLITHSFDFAVFFRSQLRRCSSLCAYYGSGKMALDFAALSYAAQSVTVLENETHYIQSQSSKRINLSGLVGFAECNGLVESMYSLLLLGSYFNAGKGATFGAGYYNIEVL